jgi:FkbM family methyltransferase
MPERAFAAAVREKLTAGGRLPRHFSNWPKILGAVASGYAVHRPRVITCATREGPVLLAPNLPMARAPIFEVVMDDVYRLDTLVAPGEQGALAVLDFGAHVGAFAVWVAHRIPSARVWCYEPSPRTYRYLVRNVTANGLGSRVTCYQEALAGTHGEVQISELEEGSCVNTTVAPQGPCTTVSAVTFGEAVRRAGGTVDVVKLDCEGAEYEGVLSSRPEDWSGVRAVVLEYHPVDGHGWEQLERFFVAAGFETARSEQLGEGLGVVWLRRAAHRDEAGQLDAAVLESS